MAFEIQQEKLTGNGNAPVSGDIDLTNGKLYASTDVANGGTFWGYFLPGLADDQQADDANGATFLDVDTAGAFAYVLDDNAFIRKFSLPNFTFISVSGTALSNNVPVASFFDKANGIIYYATGTKLAKFDVGSMSIVAEITLGGTGDGTLNAGGLIKIGNFIYIGRTTPYEILKVDATNFAGGVVGTLTTPQDGPVSYFVGNAGKLYFGGAVGRLVRVDLATFLIDGFIALPNGQPAFRAGFASTDGHLYWGMYDQPNAHSYIYKVNIASFNLNSAVAWNAPPAVGTSFDKAFVDDANGLGYFIGYSSDGNNTTLTRLDISANAGTFPPFKLYTKTGMPSALNQSAHIQIDASTGTLYKMDLVQPDFTNYYLHKIPLDTLHSVASTPNSNLHTPFALDRTNQFAFLMGGQGTNFFPKVDLSNFSVPANGTYPFQNIPSNGPFASQGTTVFGYGENIWCNIHEPINNWLFVGISKNHNRGFIQDAFTVVKYDASNMTEIQHGTVPVGHDGNPASTFGVAQSYNAQFFLDSAGGFLTVVYEHTTPGNTMGSYRWNIADITVAPDIGPDTPNFIFSTVISSKGYNGHFYIPASNPDDGSLIIQDYTFNPFALVGTILFDDYRFEQWSDTYGIDYVNGILYMGLNRVSDLPGSFTPVTRIDLNTFTRLGEVFIPGTFQTGVGAFGDGNGFFYILGVDSAEAGSAPFFARLQVGALPDTPMAPTNLRAPSSTQTGINLTWTINSVNELGFKIDRGTDGINFVQVGTVGIGVNTFGDTGLTAGTTYYYRVRAYNGNGNSDYTNYMNATTLATPSAVFAWLRTGISGLDDLYQYSFRAGFGISLATGKLYQEARFLQGGLTYTLFEISPTSLAFERSVVLPGTGNASDAGTIVVDDANGFIYTSTYDVSGQTLAIKVDLSTFLVVATGLFGANEDGGILLDAPNNFVYYNEYTSLEKRNTSDLTSAGTFAFTNYVRDIQGDFANDYIYGVSDPGYVQRVIASTMTDAGFIDLGGNVNVQAQGAIDTVNGVLYIFPLIDGLPVIVRIDLATFTRMPDTPMEVDETAIYLGYVDNANGFLYLISQYSDGFIIKYSLSPFQRLDRVAFSPAVDTGVILASSDGKYYSSADPSNFPGVLEFTAGGVVPPPTAPTNLRAVDSTTTSVSLTWDDNSGDETGFKIEQSLDGLIWNEIHVTGPDVESYTVPGLSPATLYYFQVRAFNGGGNSAYTNVALGTTLATPVSGFNILRSTVLGLGVGGASGSTGFARSPATNKFYVGFADGATLRINEISPHSLSVLRELALTAGPFGSGTIAIDSTGTFLYTSQGHRVYKVDIATMMSVADGPTYGDDNADSGLLLDEVGGILYMFGNLNGLHKFDTTTMMEIGTPLDLTIGGNGSNKFLGDLDNDFGYVTNIQSSVITKVQLSTLSIVDSLDTTGFSIGQVAIDVAGGKIYAFDSTGVITIDLSTFTRVPGAVAFAGDEGGGVWSGISDFGNLFLYVGTGESPTQQKIVQFGITPLTRVGRQLVPNPAFELDISIFAPTNKGYFLASDEVTPSNPRIVEFNVETVAPPVPAAPTNLAAIATASSIIGLTWTVNSVNEDGFRVEQSLDGLTFAQAVILPPATASYVVRALSPATQYFFRVFAFNMNGDSDPSNTANATTEPPPANSIVRDFNTDPDAQGKGLPQDGVRVLFDVKEVLRDTASKLLGNKRSQVQSDILDFLESLDDRLVEGQTQAGVFLSPSLVDFILSQRDRAVSYYNLNTLDGNYEAALIMLAISSLLE